MSQSSLQKKLSSLIVVGLLILLITPSELPILEVNFLELARIQGVVEADGVALVNIRLIFISCLVYLVEVSIDKPFSSHGRFLRGELLEKKHRCDCCEWDPKPSLT